MIKNIPQITEKQIKLRVGDQSFQRGKKYFSNEAIFAARQVKNALKANCDGSRGASYQVVVEFDKKSIINASCSCPVGSGGYCKHVAALLLTWKHTPEKFSKIPPIDTALNKKSKQCLITLIKHLVEQEPDLELAIEAFISPKEKGKILNPEIYQRQAERIFRDSMHQWRGGLIVANKLSSIRNLGDQFVKSDNFQHAWAVYQGVAQEIIRYLVEYEFHDEEGDVCNVVNDCICGIRLCLLKVKDRQLREKLLYLLFSITKADIGLGGIDLGYDALGLIYKHSTSAEKKLVVEWVKEFLPKKNCWAKEEYDRIIKRLTK